MSLAELVAGVEAHEKTLTVYNPDEEAAEELRETLASRNVAVVAERCRGPENFLVLADGDEFVAAAPVADIVDQPPSTEPGFVADSYRPILDHLDETMFTAYGRPKMMAATREIEDRAWRSGTGELHTGFQRAENFAPQTDAYRRLAGKSDLDVHAYATPPANREDWPDVDGVHFHLQDTEELRRSWFVAYDGDGLAENKCALLAEERGDDGFYGFWTYDASTVDYIIDHLRDTYGYVESDDGESPTR